MCSFILFARLSNKPVGPFKLHCAVSDDEPTKLLMHFIQLNQLRYFDLGTIPTNLRQIGQFVQCN